ncbi:hypothetical protein KRN18_00330 (plasmid) [Escherichia coli]
MTVFDIKYRRRRFSEYLLHWRSVREYVNAVPFTEHLGSGIDNFLNIIGNRGFTECDGVQFTSLFRRRTIMKAAGIVKLDRSVRV